MTDVFLKPITKIPKELSQLVKNIRIDNLDIEKFYNRVAKFMSDTYGCKKEEAVQSVQNALSFDYAVCVGKKGSVLVQTNVYRNTVYVGCVV